MHSLLTRTWIGAVAGLPARGAAGPDVSAIEQRHQLGAAAVGIVVVPSAIRQCSACQPRVVGVCSTVDNSRRRCFRRCGICQAASSHERDATAAGRRHAHASRARCLRRGRLLCWSSSRQPLVAPLPASRIHSTFLQSGRGEPAHEPAHLVRGPSLRTAVPCLAAREVIISMVDVSSQRCPCVRAIR